MKMMKVSSMITAFQQRLSIPTITRTSTSTPFTNFPTATRASASTFLRMSTGTSGRESNDSITRRNTKANDDESTPHNKRTFNVAIVGGGITGSCAASIFTSFNNHPINQQSNNSNNSSNGNNNENNSKSIIEPYISSFLLQELASGNDSVANGNCNFQVNVDLFDQGRSGVGGRTSHRQRTIPRKCEEDNKDNKDNTDTVQLRWDHGCQFFRADTNQFQHVVSNWMTDEIKLVQEWKGTFAVTAAGSDTNNTNIDHTHDHLRNEFFGFPSKPPFYVGSNGMQSISKGLLEHLQQQSDQPQQKSPSLLNVYTGTRVAKVQRDTTTQKWYLYGMNGTLAYHDTPEQKIKDHMMKNNNSISSTSPYIQIGSSESRNKGYDAILFTDVSTTSFTSWHRASANVPIEFAKQVQTRLGSRVPLFTAMIAFDCKETNIPFDAMSFVNHDTLWFASKMNSKPMNTMNIDENHTTCDGDKRGNSRKDLEKECWTIVSTPEYAIEKIEETPMQTENGEFIPQSKDYLTTVPGPDLANAFIKELTDDEKNKEMIIPDIIYLDAQRWGSAMPAHRHLDENSKTRKVISNVPYDSGRSSLAPTKLEVVGSDNDDGVPESSTATFVADESLMLFQAGDMMSTYTPGFEGAAISGIDVAEHILKTFSQK